MNTKCPKCKSKWLEPLEEYSSEGKCSVYRCAICSQRIYPDVGRPEDKDEVA
jgi:DNA-directed RNA polymerase subunit RPC12/RpoP